MKFWLHIEDQAEVTRGAEGTKEEAYAAKIAHIAYIKANGFVFEGSTELWVRYNDEGWDQWQDVHVEDEAGSHWFVGDEPNVKPLPADPDENNEERSQAAEKAIEYHLEALDDPATALTGLLSDLMHWCDRHGVEFDDCLERAQEHYSAETTAEEIVE